MVAAMCPYVRNYYGCLIKNEMDVLVNMIYSKKIKSNRQGEKEKQFTLQELAKYDGSKGKPAYIAVSGVVYDVSLSPAWGGGTHFGLYAGKDLTSEFKACHKGNIGILENIPKVGQIKSS